MASTPEFVRACRVDSVAAFAAAVERLSDVTAGVGGLGRELRGLADVLAADGTDAAGAQEIQAALSALSDAAEAALRTHAEAGSTAALRALRAVADAIAAEARQLSAVASMTSVTSGSLGASGLEAYVEGLRASAASLADHGKALERAVDDAASAERAWLAATTAAAALVDATATRLATDRRPAEAAARSAAARAELSTAAADIPVAAARETNALIVAMQASDSFSQRLEHVEHMLAIRDGRENALAALAAAQLDALRDDAAALCADTFATLNRLGDVGARALERFAAAGDGADGGAVDEILRARRTAMEETAAAGRAMRGMLDSAAAAANAIRNRIADVEAEVLGIGRAAEGIAISAMNAILLTARSGASRAAFTPLSAAVRESADVFSARANDCRRNLAALSLGFGEARFEALEARSRALEASFDSSERGLSESEAAQEEVARLREGAAAAASQLLDAIAHGARAFERVRATTDRLREIAARIAPTAGAAQAERLTDIYALYTMDREREVHDALTTRSAA